MNNQILTEERKQEIDRIVEYIETVYQDALKYLHENNGLIYDTPFFESFYMFTNEDVSAYMSNVNIKDGNVLCVGSSGDQILYSLMHGAKNVTCFDINPYVKFYYDLKVAAMQKYDFNEFISRFSMNQSTKNAIDKKLVDDVKDLMPEDSRYFWEKLYNSKVFDIVNPVTIISRPTAKHPENHYTYYHNQEQFEAMKEALKQEHTVRFLNSDVSNIYPLVKGENFDLILLSNIYQYVSEEAETRDAFFATCNNLLTLLNKDGAMQTHYVFGNFMGGFHESVFKDQYPKHKVENVECSIFVFNKPRTSEFDEEFAENGSSKS